MKKVEMTNPRYTLLDGSLQIENSEEDDQGKYECVAENSVGTEHSKSTNLYVKVRRVPPQFSRPPDLINEVMLGGNLTLTCVAVGSPMPRVIRDFWFKALLIAYLKVLFHILLKRAIQKLYQPFLTDFVAPPPSLFPVDMSLAVPKK